MKIKIGIDTQVTGDFLIVASNKDVFYNRKQILEELTGFSTGGFDSYEKYDDCNIYRVITRNWFDSKEDLIKTVKKLEKIKWVYMTDSNIMIDGEYFYCDKAIYYSEFK